MTASPARASLVSLVLRLRAVIALVVLSIVFSFLSPEFLTTGNLAILIKHVAINAILAIGMTGVIATKGMTSLGVQSTSLPTGTIILILVAAIAAGILAAIWPARRAAKLNVLEAIATE